MRAPDDSRQPRLDTNVRGSVLQSIPRFCIEHPYSVVPIYLAVIALSVLCVEAVIPRRFAPYVPSPMLGVVTMMPGLSAREMELYISDPIEQQLVNVKDLHYIRSTSEDGISIVTLEFNYGVDMQRALTDVQSLMNLVQSQLPAMTANLKPSYIVPVDPLNLPVMSLALTGDKALGWSPARLRQFADNTVINRIKTISSVRTVSVFGGYRRQLQVLVNRDRLAAYHLSILDVVNAIDRYNTSQSAGVVTGASTETIVRVDTRARSARDVLNYPITSVAPDQGTAATVPAGSMPSGGNAGMGGDQSSNAAATGEAAAGFGALVPRVVYIRDVARVVDGYWERRSAYNFVSHQPGTKGAIIPAIEVSVIQDPAASSYSVRPAVNRVLRDLEADYPGVHFQAAYDNAHFVQVLFDNVWHELGVAILLTAVAVLFFLGEWRGTIIALITLPTSLALAILMLAPFHMSFNSGTLIGLLLVIGRLVDDSIIDIHSVERHLRMGKDARTATVDGIGEVRVAVIAATLMLVLALSPLLVSGGITELMFVELVWPIIFGLLASMIVSFTLTPILCAAWLRPEAAREADRLIPFLGLLYLLLDPFQRMLDRLEHWYAGAIIRMLRNRFWNFARIAATVIIGFTFYNFIGSEMMPLGDVGQASGFLEMQPGSSFQRTEQATRQLEQILLRYPAVQRASVEIGTENMFESFNPNYTGYQMPQVNGAALMLTLSDKDSRSRDIWQIIDSVQREALRTIPGIRRLQIKEMGADVMATADAPIYLIAYGPRLHVLNQIGQAVLDIAKHTYGMAQPATTWTMAPTAEEIRIDPQRAAEVGLSPAQVAEQGYYALHGGLTQEFYRLPNLRQNTIDVRYDDSDRSTLSDLHELYLSAPGGREVPLDSVATVVPQEEPTAIEHDGLRRVIGISGYYRKWGPPSMDLSMRIMMKAMDSVNFPPGYGIEMRGDMTQMMDSFRRLLYGLALAIVLMYLVLVAQFRGFLQPLQMIASLPLELSGVFFALWLAHQAFSTVSIMAVIVLSGMDMTTAILMIDMIMRYRDRGVPRDQAVAQACPQRLRPILMTSIITLIVMAPVAIAPKTGLDSYQPLGTTILGGLTVGTILSLFDIPILHTYVDDLTVWLNRVFLKREWRWPVTSAPEEAP